MPKFLEVCLWIKKYPTNLYPFKIPNQSLPTLRITNSSCWNRFDKTTTPRGLVTYDLVVRKYQRIISIWLFGYLKALNGFVFWSGKLLCWTVCLLTCAPRLCKLPLLSMCVFVYWVSTFCMSTVSEWQEIRRIIVVLPYTSNIEIVISVLSDILLHWSV